MSGKQYVLVTGGSGGIGSELCRGLRSRNVTPIVAYFSDRVSAEALAEHGDGFVLPLDLADDESIQKALDIMASNILSDDSLIGVILAASKPPDLLRFNQLTEKLILDQIRINVIGPQILLAGLIGHFFRKKRTGTVLGILTDGLAGQEKQAATGMGSYIIAKTAMKGMLDVCAAEYNWLKVRTYSPSFTRTKMLDIFDERYLELVRLQKEIVSPDAVATSLLDEFFR